MEKKQIWATVLGINISEDCAALKIRVNRVYAGGKYYPQNYPFEKASGETRFILNYHKEQPGLRKIDLIKIFPGDDIVIHLSGASVDGLEIKEKTISLQKVISINIAKHNK